jgi:hypothetical protein
VALPELRARVEGLGGDGVSRRLASGAPAPWRRAAQPPSACCMRLPMGRGSWGAPTRLTRWHTARRTRLRCGVGQGGAVRDEFRGPVFPGRQRRRRRPRMAWSPARRMGPPRTRPRRERREGGLTARDVLGGGRTALQPVAGRALRARGPCGRGAAKEGSSAGATARGAPAPAAMGTLAWQQGRRAREAVQHRRGAGGGAHGWRLRSRRRRCT